AFKGLTRDPHLQERLLIVGAGTSARELARQLGTQRNFPYRLIGFIDDGATDAEIRRPEIIGTTADLGRIISERHLDRLVVSLTDRRGRLPIEELLRAKLSGVRVEDATTTYERLTGKILIDDLKPSWLIFSDGFQASRLTRAVKRMLDLAF